MAAVFILCVLLLTWEAVLFWGKCAINIQGSSPVLLIGGAPYPPLPEERKVMVDIDFPIVLLTLLWR